jgi:hypothetical protein
VIKLGCGGDVSFDGGFDERSAVDYSRDIVDGFRGVGVWRGKVSEGGVGCRGNVGVSTGAVR